MTTQYGNRQVPAGEKQGHGQMQVYLNLEMQDVGLHQLQYY